MVDPSKTKYKNITVSGMPGAGSSLLGQSLEEKLGWEYFSGGDFMRQHAIAKGLFDKKNSVHHAATVYNEDFDRQVDYGMRETLKKQTGRILESWLSGFVAQGIGGVLKVLVYCSNDDVRVDRLVNRDEVTIAEAKKHIFERQKNNLTKWTKMYQKEWHKWVAKEKQKHRIGEYLNFYHPSLYDVVIDTYAHDREATLKIVLKKLGV
jgi:cytidylate kinase